MSYTRLGEMPRSLGHTVEPFDLWVETAPTTGSFEARGYPVESAEVSWGGNDRIPTARIRVGLGAHPELLAMAAPLRDWQLYDLADNPVSPLLIFGGRRRLQLRTSRPLPMEDWLIFDGYIDGVQLGWSANSDSGRWLALQCTGAICAADRELSQRMIGQYRRTRDAEALRAAGDDSAASDATVCCTALTVSFNPGGHGNCDRRPLTLADGTQVYVFCDPKSGHATRWNVARMLRYLHWASLQAGPTPPGLSWDREPYLASIKGALTGFTTATWCSIGLWHSPRQPYQTLDYARPNLELLVDPHLAAEAAPAVGSPQAVALRSQPSTVTVHGFSILEALAFICDRAGLMMEPRNAMDFNGRALHFLRFCARGDWVDDQGILPDPGDQGGAPAPDIPPPTETPSSRLVSLYLTSDRRGLPDSIWPEQRALRDASAGGGGQLALDEQRLRALVIRIGETCEFEMTVGRRITWPVGQVSFSLLPGWEIDDWWDVDPADEDAVQQAQARIGSEEWQERYGERASVRRRNTGRLWVLNEDGRFAGPFYSRAKGPFAGGGLWEPYRFATQGLVRDLRVAPPGGVARGDAGWSARRRRFLPTIARAREDAALGEDSCKLPPLIELSFDGGASFYPAVKCGGSPEIDNERCAVRMTNAAPEEIHDPVTRTTLPEAYMAGLFRLVVTANIEGDDAAWGWSKELSQPPAGPPWGLVVVGRGRRRLRTSGAGNQPAANSIYVANADYRAHVAGVNESDQEALTAEANAMRDESLSPAWVGEVRVPWWHRDTDTVAQTPSLRGYRVGDKARELATQVTDTRIDLGAGRALIGAATRLSRVAAITYRYRLPAEFETLVELERPLRPGGTL
ncbi:MAG TPA: hypothetical protein PKC49_00340 [Phycisphaerae bacterium]|nr:hypothetical protein [Phycisphaerae bacterium]